MSKTVAPTSMTLGGLIKHLAYVEEDTTATPTCSGILRMG
ncbi:DinB family protein [Arthrobacter bambusae]|jgi:hypothetical protein|nr:MULTISPECIES: DinB family protein [Arthrobacter]MCI0140706.1 DinB family protein [Arthrobacter bambusae]UYY81432.1 DinB family protein [Arthrobacter sp. YA7-1]